jgi:hypothetical protein
MASGNRVSIETALLGEQVTQAEVQLYSCLHETKEC